MRRAAKSRPRPWGTPARLLIVAAVGWGACSRAPSEDGDGAADAGGHIGYGTVMAEVARRFELLGRAANAGRFEFAQYELGEIGELFEETLPRAEPPREGQPDVLPGLARSFVDANLPDLRSGLEAGDRTQAAAAFERAAKACNACHEASGHAFIEVPLRAGESIPKLDDVQAAGSMPSP